MPEDRKQQRKIFKLMEKAAETDRNVSPEERQLLESIRAEYKIDCTA